MATETSVSPDPYDLTLPDEWTVAAGDTRTIYEDDDATVRVVITEFSRNLTLYWWVDVVAREAPEAPWTRRAVGPETTYRNPEAAAEHAEKLVHEAESGRAFTDAPPTESPDLSGPEVPERVRRLE